MGDSCGDDNNVNIEARTLSKDHDWFIDVCYTTPNNGAGKARLLTFGVMLRLETWRTHQLVDMILASIKPNIMFTSAD